MASGRSSSARVQRTTVRPLRCSSRPVRTASPTGCSERSRPDNRRGAPDLLPTTSAIVVRTSLKAVRLMRGAVRRGSIVRAGPRLDVDVVEDVQVVGDESRSGKRGPDANPFDRSLRAGRTYLVGEALARRMIAGLG